MKTFILSLIFISSLFSFELDWINDYDKAIELAKKEHKDIYLFIGADKCPFCKKFKEQTLSQKSVIDALKKDFITIYLSRDQHHIPDRFEKYGAPRHYFLDENGKIIFDSFGFLEPAGFFTLLDEVDLSRD
jgi:thioredoxin-related protein